MKTYSSVNGKFEVRLPEEYNNGEVVGRVWEKEGKVRLYVKVYFKSCSPCDCGYIDMVSGKSYLQSQPRGVARVIESETEIVEISQEVVENDPFEMMDDSCSFFVSSKKEVKEVEEVSEVAEVAEVKEEVKFNFGRREVLTVAWSYFRRNFYETFAACLKAAWADMRKNDMQFLIELKKKVKRNRKALCDLMLNAGIESFMKDRCGLAKSFIPRGEWFEPYDALFAYLNAKGL